MATLLQEAQARLAKRETFEALMRELYAARRAKATADVALKEAREAWERGPGAPLLSAAGVAAQALAATEEQVRQAAAEQRVLRASTDVGFGIGFRKKARGLVYDVAAALAWAIAKKQCVTLDVSAFEKAAKRALGDEVVRQTTGLDFVALAPEVEEVTLPNTERLALYVAPPPRTAAEFPPVDGARAVAEIFPSVDGVPR